eukprot:TRINITY_DN5551_c0_g1_i1.p1 TRINITY_DN5551_c0_g1~~TRINITY_DN5551_c0_g1_i1.p1  ORF type:complete len:840 (+),score=152.19 TRINITY_DN5551_c0_g1_i1:195-2522(+)
MEVLRDVSDVEVIDYEVKLAKARIFDSWMKTVREQAADLSPAAARALEHLEKAHEILFARGKIAMEQLARPIVEVHSEAQQIDVLAENVAAEAVKPSRASVIKQKLRTHLPELIPIMIWLPTYMNMGPDPALYNPPKGDRKSLLRAIWSTARSDLLGGITTGLVIIPQGMAYAKLGGVPQIMGLYAGFIGTLVYTFFGTSRQLACGPLALVSLMVNAATESWGISADDLEAKASLATALGLCVGVVFLSMAIFRLGFLVHFLSMPVLNGFTSAAAVIIGASQLSKLFGLHVDFSNYPWLLIYRVLAHMKEANGIAVAIGFVSLAAIIVMKKISLKIPGATIAMVITILISWQANLESHHVDIVGAITPGLPPLTIPWNYNTTGVAEMGGVTFADLFANAVVIAIVGFMEHISVAKFWARHFKYEGVDANQEMLALGLANFVGSFFSAYPMCGTVGRSAVAAAAGARSQFTSLLTGIILGLVLLVATPLFYYLPQAVLAAVVMSAVYSLVDYHIVIVLWRESRADLIPLLVTFFVTVIAGVEFGIVLAVLTSLLLTLAKAARPQTSILGRAPGTVIYRDTKAHKNCTTTPGVIVFRFDGDIFFGNTNFLREQLTEAEKKLPTDEKLHSIVLDFSAVTDLDYSGIVEFKDLLEDYRRRNVVIAIANLDNDALRTFQRAGLIKLIGTDHFFFRVHDAVLAVQGGHLPVFIPEPPPPPPPGCADKLKHFECSKEGLYRTFPCLTRGSRSGAGSQSFVRSNTVSSPAKGVEEESRLEPEV